MPLLAVGSGEAIVSNSPNDIIKAYGMGSCVGLIMLDPLTRTAGLAHIALPDSRIKAPEAAEKPAYFADTGVEYLIRMMNKFGACEFKRYIIKLVGGAIIHNTSNHFDIGNRNITAIKRILWEKRLYVTAEDTGNNYSRTVTVNMKTGKVIVSSANLGEWVL